MKDDAIGRIVALLPRFSEDFLEAIAQRLEEQTTEDPVRQRPDVKAAGDPSGKAKRQATASQAWCGMSKTAEKPGSRVIGSKEFAVLMGCAASTFRHDVKCGLIAPPSRVPGRHPLWNRRDIEAWFEGGCPTAERWTEIKGNFHRGSVVGAYSDRLEEDRAKAEAKERLRVHTA